MVRVEQGAVDDRVAKLNQSPPTEFKNKIDYFYLLKKRIGVLDLMCRNKESYGIDLQLTK